MASARVLSATELGAIRFAASSSKGSWPVEVRYLESSGSLAPSPREVLAVQAGPSDGNRVCVPLTRAARGEWRAVLEAPVGPLQYSVTKGGAEICPSSTFVVRQPDQPVENTRLAAKLRSRAPSGARQLDSPANADGHWNVRFVYSEAAFGVRDIFVELQIGVDDDPVSVKCVREDDNDGNTVYVAEFPLPPKEHRYRFRVLYSEVTAPDAAPFTRLGFDPGPSGSGTRGLYTWELTATVNDLSRGEAAGESVMNHEKRFALNRNGSIGIVSSTLSQEHDDGKTPSSFSVQSVATALDLKERRTASHRVTTSSGVALDNLREGRTIMPGTGTSTKGKSDSSPSRVPTKLRGVPETESETTPEADDEDANQQATLRSLPRFTKPVLGVALIAMAVGCALASASDSDHASCDEDNLQDRKALDSSLASGYVKHANSQSL